MEEKANLINLISFFLKKDARASIHSKKRVQEKKGG